MKVVSESFPVHIVAVGGPHNRQFQIIKSFNVEKMQNCEKTSFEKLKVIGKTGLSCTLNNIQGKMSN
jgi:hypothetical protein